MLLIDIQRMTLRFSNTFKRYNFLEFHNNSQIKAVLT